MSLILSTMLASSFVVDVDLVNEKRQYSFTADPLKMSISELIRGMPKLKKINGIPSKITIKIKNRG